MVDKGAVKLLPKHHIFERRPSDYNKYIKLVLGTILLIALILFAYFLYKYLHKTMLIPNMVSGMQAYGFKSKRLPLAGINQGMEYTFQFWIYINSWAYKFGDNKTILYWRGNTAAVSPSRILDKCKKAGENGETEGEGTLSESGDRVDWIQDTCVDCPPNPLLESFDGFSTEVADRPTLVDDTNSAVYAAFWEALGSQSSDIGGLRVGLGDSDNTLRVFHTMMNGRVSESVVHDLPLQKWLNVFVILQQRHLDIFVNGELKHSTLLPSIPDYRTGTLRVNPNGGFDGYLSRLNYTPRAFRIQEIQKEFHHGPSGTDAVGKDFGDMHIPGLSGDLSKAKQSLNQETTKARERELVVAHGKCSHDSDCRSDLKCKYGVCQYLDRSRLEGQTCTANGDCTAGLICNNIGPDRVSDSQIQYLTRRGIPTDSKSTWNARLGGKPSTCIMQKI